MELLVSRGLLLFMDKGSGEHADLHGSATSLDRIMTCPDEKAVIKCM